MSKKPDLNIKIFNISCPKCREFRQFATNTQINQKVCMTCSKHGKYYVTIYPQAENEMEKVVYST